MAIERLEAPLAAADAERLAALHAQTLPRSLIATLGERYVRAFYAYCAASAHETLRVARAADGAVTAACVVSARPDDLGKRLRAATPLLSAAATHPRAWPDLLRAALGGGTPATGAEIVLLFTDAATRGRGLGAALVEAAVRDAVPLSVVTEDDPDNLALAFYRKNGFMDSGPVRLNGKAFRRLVRDV